MAESTCDAQGKQNKNKKEEAKKEEKKIQVWKGKKSSHPMGPRAGDGHDRSMRKIVQTNEKVALISDDVQDCAEYSILQRRHSEQLSKMAREPHNKGKPER